MLKLKPLSKEAIAGALERAVRYRLLNEPLEAESICLDILEIEPENEQALITLLLSLTDQFERRFAAAVSEARALLPRLPSDYHRAYYEGIIWERRASALYDKGGPSSGQLAHDGLSEALRCYETAIELRPQGKDDPILRWNTCIRIMRRHPDIKPSPEENFHPLLE